MKLELIQVQEQERAAAERAIQALVSIHSYSVGLILVVFECMFNFVVSKIWTRKEKSKVGFTCARYWTGLFNLLTDFGLLWQKCCRLHNLCIVQ